MVRGGDREEEEEEEELGEELRQVLAQPSKLEIHNRISRQQSALSLTSRGRSWDSRCPPGQGSSRWRLELLPGPDRLQELQD